MVGPYGHRLDILFGVCFLVHLLLFWFATTISWSKPRWWRVVLAATASGMVTLVPALVNWGTVLFAPSAVIAVSLLLALLVVYPCSIRQFIAVFGALWIAAPVTGGVVAALVERSGGVLGLGPPAVLVVVGFPTGLLGLALVWQAWRERQVVRDTLYQVQIEVGGQPVVLTGLFDSGNSLRTPVGRAPVAVVEVDRLRPYLPPAVVEALTMGWDALSAIPEAWQGRCQLVPYAAVGNPEGSLLVLMPDSMAIWEGRERRWVKVGGMIGLTLQPLDPHGHYQVLLPPPMLMEAEGK